jgi:hypothetical protein
VRLGNAFDTILKFAVALGQSRRHNIRAMGGRTRPVRIEADGLADAELVLAHWRLPYPFCEEPNAKNYNQQGEADIEKRAISREAGYLVRE